MKKKLNKKIKKQEKGFTLVETLVAIFILLLSITGPMSAAQSSLQASFLARDQIVAYYMAQEAIEFIKNFKNQEAINGNDWRENPQLKGNCIVQGNGNAVKECNVDVYTNSWYQCPASGSFENLACGFMKENSSGIFLYDNSNNNSSSNTKFKRSIFLKQIQNSQNPGETEVVVVVEWKTASLLAGTKRIEVQENIYNWIPTN